MTKKALYISFPFWLAFGMYLALVLFGAGQYVTWSRIQEFFGGLIYVIPLIVRDHPVYAAMVFPALAISLLLWYRYPGKATAFLLLVAEFFSAPHARVFADFYGW